MTRRKTILGGLLGSRWIARPGRRRGTCFAVALVLAILSVWPRPYNASALLAPDDSAAGLSALFSGGGGVNLFSSLLNGRSTIEADLLIGRSNAVYSAVARKLQTQGWYREMTVDKLQARLSEKIEVESLRGSILHISTKNQNPDLALQIVRNFVEILRTRLTALSVDQANEKRAIAGRRMDDASALLEQSHQTLNRYRAAHNFSNPEVQLSFSQGAQITLQGQLQAAQAALSTATRTVGPDNVQLKVLRDRIEVLQRYIAAIETRPGSGSVQSLSKLNPELAEFRQLLRNEGYAQERFEIYKRYLESLTVQEAAAPLSLDVIDPPFIDPRRDYNYTPLGLLALLVVAAVIAEVYLAAPVTTHSSDRATNLERSETRDTPASVGTRR